MTDEIEVKFKVADFAPVRRALRRAGAAHVATVIQTDTYYDTPGGTLLGRDCGLRVRRVRCLRSPGGRLDTRPLLTAKGPRRGRFAKMRREAQTRLDDPKALDEILRLVGVAPAVTIQKRRSTYRLGRSLVELDELPVIGKFVEVESPSRSALDSACRRLGLTGERITDHYVSLLARTPDWSAGRRDFKLRPRR